MRQSHPWLIFTPDIKSSTSSTSWEQILKKVNLRMDSDVKIAISQDQNTFKILDVYNPGQQIGELPVITEFGNWNGSDLEIKQHTSFYLQRKDMSNIELRSGSVVLITNHSGSFEGYMLDARYKQLDTMSKFHYPMFLLLEDVHNFT